MYYSDRKDDESAASGPASATARSTTAPAPPMMSPPPGPPPRPMPSATSAPVEVGAETPTTRPRARLRARDDCVAAPPSLRRRGVDDEVRRMGANSERDEYLLAHIGLAGRGFPGHGSSHVGVSGGLQERPAHHDPPAAGTACARVPAGSRIRIGYMFFEWISRASRPRVRHGQHRRVTRERPAEAAPPPAARPRPPAGDRGARGPQPTMVYRSGAATSTALAPNRHRGAAQPSAPQAPALAAQAATPCGVVHCAPMMVQTLAPNALALQMQHSVAPPLSVFGAHTMSQPQAVADAFRNLADLIAPRPSTSPQIHILMAPQHANLSLSEAGCPPAYQPGAPAVLCRRGMRATTVLYLRTATALYMTVVARDGVFSITSSRCSIDDMSAEVHSEGQDILSDMSPEVNSEGRDLLSVPCFSHVAHRTALSPLCSADRLAS